MSILQIRPFSLRSQNEAAQIRCIMNLTVHIQPVALGIRSKRRTQAESPWLCARAQKGQITHMSLHREGGSAVAPLQIDPRALASQTSQIHRANLEATAHFLSLIAPVHCAVRQMQRIQRKIPVSLHALTNMLSNRQRSLCATCV